MSMPSPFFVQNRNCYTAAEPIQRGMPVKLTPDGKQVTNTTGPDDALIGISTSDYNTGGIVEIVWIGFTDVSVYPSKAGDEIRLGPTGSPTIGGDGKFIGIAGGDSVGGYTITRLGLLGYLPAAGGGGGGGEPIPLKIMMVDEEYVQIGEDEWKHSLFIAPRDGGHPSYEIRELTINAPNEVAESGYQFIQSYTVIGKVPSSGELALSFGGNAFPLYHPSQVPYDTQGGAEQGIAAFEILWTYVDVQDAPGSPAQGWMPSVTITSSGTSGGGEPIPLMVIGSDQETIITGEDEWKHSVVIMPDDEHPTGEFREIIINAPNEVAKPGYQYTQAYTVFAYGQGSEPLQLGFDGNVFPLYYPLQVPYDPKEGIASFEVMWTYIDDVFAEMPIQGWMPSVTICSVDSSGGGGEEDGPRTEINLFTPLWNQYGDTLKGGFELSFSGDLPTTDETLGITFRFGQWVDYTYSFPFLVSDGHTLDTFATAVGDGLVTYLFDNFERQVYAEPVTYDSNSNSWILRMIVGNGVPPTTQEDYAVLYNMQVESIQAEAFELAGCWISSGYLGEDAGDLFPDPLHDVRASVYGETLYSVYFQPWRTLAAITDEFAQSIRDSFNYPDADVESVTVDGLVVTIHWAGEAAEDDYFVGKTFSTGFLDLAIEDITGGPRAAETAFSPADPAHWDAPAPDNTAAALDQIASRMSAAESKPAVVSSGKEAESTWYELDAGDHLIVVEWGSVTVDPDYSATNVVTRIHTIYGGQQMLGGCVTASTDYYGAYASISEKVPHLAVSAKSVETGLNVPAIVCWQYTVRVPK